MMKSRKKPLLLLALGILLSTAIVFFIPFTYSKTIDVPFTIVKTTELVIYPNQLEKWFLPFTGQDQGKVERVYKPKAGLKWDGYTLSLESSNAVITQYTFTNNKEKLSFSIGVEPEIANAQACKVILQFRSSLWKMIAGSFTPLQQYVISSIDNFYDYTNSTERFYGYKIELGKVVDTAYLYASKTVPAGDIKAGQIALYDTLLAFAKEKNAKYNGTRIFYKEPAGEGSTKLFASIAVNSRVLVQPDDEIRYKMMPMGKNLLIATYHGPYGKVDAVYKALEDFKRDYSLVSMAIPFERFKTKGYGFSPGDTVDLEVCYPIF